VEKKPRAGALASDGTSASAPPPPREREGRRGWARRGSGVVRRRALRLNELAAPPPRSGETHCSEARSIEADLERCGKAWRAVWGVSVKRALL
tara:strand:+ start:154 stop:432 length:279 start_codon:yes stop_codon:yes gene_type:complete